MTVLSVRLLWFEGGVWGGGGGGGGGGVFFMDDFQHRKDSVTKTVTLL